MNTMSSLKPQIVSLPGDALATDASGRPVLIGSACRSCGSQMFPSAPVCSVCMSEDVLREPMPREGKLYSFTVMHVGPKTWEKPFAVGYVDLTNGVRLFTHLRGAELAIGRSVELAVAEVGKTAEGETILTAVFQQAKA